MEKVVVPIVKDGLYSNEYAIDRHIVGSMQIPPHLAKVIAALFEGDLPVRLGGVISLSPTGPDLHAVSIYAAEATPYEAGWQACKAQVLKELAILEEDRSAEMKVEADCDNISAWESLVQSIKDCSEVVRALRQVKVTVTERS